MSALRTVPLVAIVLLSAWGAAEAGNPASSAVPTTAAGAAVSIEDAQRSFYNGRYDEAAARTLEPCSSASDGLAACELRTAALLFQIKRALGKAPDKKKALKACDVCPELMSAFQAALSRGQELARARLQTHADEESTLFFLGKLDLNHVWLRRSLDKVLEQNPAHVRARVARGWIDYIVGTKMRRGTRWLLGGGNKKNGLLAVREAASTEAPFFVRTEALFALWDMQVRERKLQEAVATARRLAEDFPENRELREFIEANGRLAAGPN
jgi:hypothetical protein